MTCKYVATQAVESDDKSLSRTDVNGELIYLRAQATFSGR